jgi:hypothetical protein
MDDSMCSFMDQFKRMSEEICVRVDQKLAWIKEEAGIERCRRADALFGTLYREIVGVDPTQWKLTTYLAIGRQIALKVADSQWADVHKGAHYYNLGLAEILNGNIDGASRYFLLADHENEKHKRLQPGGLFRNEKIYDDLRAFILDPWFAATEADYHDGLCAWSERRDRMIKALGNVRGRYVVSRCQAGLWRACFLSHRLPGMLLPSELERVRAVEDMGVFSELVARKFDGTPDKPTLGELLRSERVCGKEDFVLNRRFRFEPDSASSTESLDTLRKAREGDRGAIAGVVRSARNQAMHSSEFADWYLQPRCLQDVVKVQLDFISSLAAKHADFAP